MSFLLAYADPGKNIHTATFDEGEGNWVLVPGQVSIALTSDSPAVAHNSTINTFLMAWKAPLGDPAGDTAIYWATSQDGKTWQVSQQPIPGAHSDYGPVLTTFGKQFFIAWRGVGNDNGVYTLQGDGSSWNSITPVGFIATGQRPGYVRVTPSGSNSPVDAFVWKGDEDDVHLYSSATITGGSNPEKLGGSVTSHSPALIYWNAGNKNPQYLMAYQGAAGDTNISWTFCNVGGDWAASQFAASGQALTSQSPALAVDNNEVMMVWKDAMSNGMPWMIQPPNAGWQSPQPSITGASTAFAPGLCSF